MRELFSLIDNELRQSGFKNKLRAGIVLTGGGSLLRGCGELAEEVFGLPTRIGVPMNLDRGTASEIESPEFATVAGLILGAPGNFLTEYPAQSIHAISRDKIKIKNLLQKVQDFFNEL